MMVLCEYIVYVKVAPEFDGCTYWVSSWGDLELEPWVI